MTAEELSRAVASYNSLLRAEREIDQGKKRLAEELKTHLKSIPTDVLEVDGFKVAVIPRVTRSIPVELAEQVLEPGVFLKLVQVKTSIAFSVLPLRGGHADLP